MKNKGSIEIITGCMFSGKTTELIRRVKREKIAGKQVMAFKPEIDIRGTTNKITTHDNNEIGVMPIKHTNILRAIIKEAQPDVIAIDEIQFFQNKAEDFFETIFKTVNNGIKVILAGLDMDFTGKPFKITQFFLSRAEKVKKLSAICSICKQDAHFSQRIVDSTKLIEIGGTDKYEARCRTHFKGE